MFIERLLLRWQILFRKLRTHPHIEWPNGLGPTTEITNPFLAISLTIFPIHKMHRLIMQQNKLTKTMQSRMFQKYRRRHPENN